MFVPGTLWAMTGAVWQPGEARVHWEHVCQGGSAAVTSARGRVLAPEHVRAGQAVWAEESCGAEVWWNR